MQIQYNGVKRFTPKKSQQINDVTGFSKER